MMLLLLFVQSKPFWIMARAVKEFVDREGQGEIPASVCMLRPDFFRTVPNFDVLSREYYEISRDAELS